MPAFRWGLNLDYSVDTGFADLVANIRQQYTATTAPGEVSSGYFAVTSGIALTVNAQSIGANNIDYAVVVAYGNGQIDIVPNAQTAGASNRVDIDGTSTEPGFFALGPGANLNSIVLRSDSGTINFQVFLAGD